MADQIVIAELQLNTKSLQDSSARLIQDIARIRAEQRELQRETSGLTTATEEQSRQFVENDARLRQLNSEYATNRRVLAESVSGMEGLNDLLSEEITRVGDAEKANRKLSIIRSQITSETQEGRDAIEEINKRIDQNNEFIRENSDELKKQKQNVGNYKESIKEAFDELNIFNGGFFGFIQRSKEAGGVGPLLKESFNGIASGISGATKAAWGFVVNPIGLVIAALALTLGVLYGVFKTFTPVVDKAEQAMAAIGAVFNVVKNSIIGLVTGTKSLTEVFSGLGDSMADAAEQAANLKKAQQDLEDAMEQQEVTSAKMRAEINRLNIQAKDRTKTEEERLALLNKASKLEEQDFQARKKNSDEKLRIAYEEIRQSAQLSDAEFAQLKRSGLAYKEVTEQKATNQDELYNNLKDALLKSTDIENEYYSNQEKIINKQNKLIEDQEEAAKKAREDAKKRAEESAQKAKEAQDKTIQRMNEELSLFVAKENLKKKTVEEQIAFEEVVSKKRNAILEKEYAYGKISRQKYQEELILLDLESKKKQAELAVKNLEDEATLYKLQNQSRIGDARTLTEFLVDEERQRLETIYNQEKAINEKRFTDKLISENDFLIKSLELENNFEAQKKALKLNYDKQLKEEQNLQRQLDFEERNIALQEEYASQFQLDSERLTFETSEKLRVVNEIEAQFKEQKLADLEAERKEKIARDEFDLQALSEYLERRNKIETTISDRTQKAITNINRQNAIAQAKIDVAKSNAKLQGAVQVANGIAQLAGKETAVGKAAAIASTTITTYQSAVSSYNSLSGIPIVGPALGAVAAATAVASGLLTVGKIVGIGTGAGAESLAGISSGLGTIGDASDKVPKAEKGALFKIGGNRHSAGGTKFQGEDGTAFEAEEGELIGVMNRNAARAFMEFNNAYPSNQMSTRTNVFASGGFVTQQSLSNTIVDIDMELMATKIAQANSTLPPPVVYTAITDINHGQYNYAQVVSGANH